MGVSGNPKGKPKGITQRPKPTTPRAEKFIEVYTRTHDRAAAKEAAGYAKNSHAPEKNQYLATKIAEVQKAIVEKAIYTTEKAMTQAEEAIQFAKETGNANAFVKGVELKAKMSGLLVEKYDVRQSGFSLNINMDGEKKTDNPVDIVNTIIQSKKIEEDDEGDINF